MRFMIHDILSAAFFLACIALVIFPALFAYHNVYRAGLIGKLSLLAIAFASVVFAAKFITNGIYSPWHETMLFVISVAVYFVWHYLRFSARVKIERKARSGQLERRAQSLHGHG